MVAINITKFSTQTKHFYANFYHISHYLDLKKIEGGGWDIKNPSFFTSMEELYGDTYSFIKHESEKQLMENSKKFLNEHCGFVANIIVVYYEGNYSESRTIYINEKI